MEVKGTAVESIPLFVKEKFGERYEEWLNSLPPKSREIMTKPILAAIWYPLEEAFIIPTLKICELFYNGDLRGAWEAGRFSADFALRGIYKVFVKIGSPGFIIDRASAIFSNYYRPSKMEVVERGKNRAVLHITEFGKPHIVVEYRIAGWIERALEISGCKDLKITITKSLTRGDKYTEIVGEWR